MSTLLASTIRGSTWSALGLLAFVALLGPLGLLSYKVAIFFVLILALLFLRQPVVLLLAVATAFTHAWFARNSSVEFLIQDVWFTVDREVLLAIPMFMLAGALMSRGSIAQRLINVMVALTAPIPGGLGIAAVLACAVFAAISGSSIVTMLAIGSIMYPALIRSGYDRSFAIGVVCSAGTLGIMIPPSIPMILFGIMTETSITQLFVAGIGPGLFLALLFSIYSYGANRGRPTDRWSLAKIATALREGVFAMLLPVFLLGGIYTGWFTPTEAAALSLVYALLVELLIHRELGPADYWNTVLDTVKMLGTLLPLLAIASSLNTILDYEGIAKSWVTHVQGAVDSPVMLMIGINILLLIVGCLMDAGSAILIFSPLLLPLAKSAGYDAVHFGIIMTANLEIGYLTPPVGLNLIVAMAAFKENFLFICKAVLPFIAIMFSWLLLVCAWTPLTMYLVGR
ncbi:MAG: TRAP transporter large permease [Rhodospirillales bacterium]|nr:MAG: TRAP transporter large permease [Rhodospirillales bacterium]